MLDGLNDLVGAAALVGTEHDGIGRVPVEAGGSKRRVGGKKLEIRAAAVQPVLGSRVQGLRFRV